jgi:hypothetical protein
MYINGKMTSVENIPGMGGCRRMVEGVNSSIKYLIYCKNFCKCHDVPQTSTTIKKLENKKHKYFIEKIPNDNVYYLKYNNIERGSFLIRIKMGT